MTVRSSLLCFALVIASPIAAYADPKADAKLHIEAATAAHADGRFDDALKELTLAYALDPQPGLLFAIGQVHMKLGDCASATTFYDRFITSKSSPKEVAVARKAIASCKDHPPEPRPVEPRPVEPKPVEPLPAEPVHLAPPVEARLPPPPPPPPIAPPQGRPWYRDWLGHALVGTGMISGVVGLVEYRAARDSRDRADAATTYGAYEDLLDDAHRQRTLGIVFGAGGVVLAGAGLLHYALSGTPPTAEHFAVVPHRDGSLVTWTTPF